MNLYTIEKLQEFERERLENAARSRRPAPRRKSVFGPLAAGAGRTLRRLGEGLESWGAAPAPEHDHRSRAPQA
ncbi:MAG TPA: hypothetical protein VMT90_10345 [Dehalococcoidia bacterium]|jgi:hypothetical protein|nr:hypothetical protein [Dehalococcoidia bacterium]